MTFTGVARIVGVMRLIDSLSHDPLEAVGTVCLGLLPATPFAMLGLLLAG